MRGRGLAQALAAPFVADPAGDADRQPECQAVLEFPRSAGEAMQHATRSRLGMRPKHRDEIGVCVALVKKEMPAQLFAEGELQLERTALLLWRREIPEVVEPAFARRDDHRVRQQFGEPSRIAVLQRRGMVRVHASGRAKTPGMAPAQGNRLFRIVERAAGHDHCRDAGGAAALDNLLPVGVEAVVREVRADVDEDVRGHRIARRPSGGAKRRRHGLARGPKRGQEAADHADHDGDDEPVPDQLGCHRKIEHDLREVRAKRRDRHVVEKQVCEQGADEAAQERQDQRLRA